MFWWHWFKKRHLKLFICFAEGLKICKAQGLTSQFCNSFYQNLQAFYIQHSYSVYQIWNSNEIRIQVSRQLSAHVLAKQDSHQVYNVILEFREWIMNYAFNVKDQFLPRFYILRGERLWDDYIGLCKVQNCMTIQKKAWMAKFMFKELFNFFKKYIPSGIFEKNQHLWILNKYIDCIFLQVQYNMPINLD